MTAPRDWRAFVLEHGRGVLGHHLEAIVGQPAAAIRRLRGKAPLGTRSHGTQSPQLFPELFARWHGRPPLEAEWPRPRRLNQGGYEWLAPELQLLASLVGTMDKPAIAALLTERLRRVTGDPAAERSVNGVQNHVNAIGLQIGVDLVGGLTTTEAAKRVGRLAVVNQAIWNGKLKTRRVGKRHVIPVDEFERWLATRQEPPAGYVRLASLMAPLGIASDSKLPEYAALGYIPTAVKVAGIATVRGVWYLSADVATQIVADARAGRKLPWHGKPLLGNQRAMWTKWQRRKHRRCRRCAAIWRGPAPTTFEDFCARYASLTLGDKRHVNIIRIRIRRGSVGWRPHGSVATRMRRAGVTVAVAARELQQPSKWIRGLIRRGFLDGGLERDPLGGEAVRITPVGMAMLRGMADGIAAAAADTRRWVGVHDAAQIAGVSITTIHHWRAADQVSNRRGPRGTEFDVASLKARAREHWAWATRRFHRARPPAWVLVETAA